MHILEQLTHTLEQLMHTLEQFMHIHLNSWCIYTWTADAYTWTVYAHTLEQPMHTLEQFMHIHLNSSCIHLNTSTTWTQHTLDYFTSEHIRLRTWACYTPDCLMNLNVSFSCITCTHTWTPRIHETSHRHEHFAHHNKNWIPQHLMHFTWTPYTHLNISYTHLKNVYPPPPTL